MKPEDIFGVVGGVLFLAFFWRTSIKKERGRTIWSEIDIFLAAVCLSVYSYYKGAYITIVLNLVWVYIAFRGVTSYVERRITRQKRRQERLKRTKAKKRHRY